MRIFTLSLIQVLAILRFSMVNSWLLINPVKGVMAQPLAEVIPVLGQVQFPKSSGPDRFAIHIAQVEIPQSIEANHSSAHIGIGVAVAVKLRYIDGDVLIAEYRGPLHC